MKKLCYKIRKTNKLHTHAQCTHWMPNGTQLSKQPKVINVVLTKRCQIWKNKLFRNEYVCVSSVQCLEFEPMKLNFYMANEKMRKYNAPYAKRFIFGFSKYFWHWPQLQTHSYVSQLTTMKWVAQSSGNCWKRNLNKTWKLHSAFWHVRCSTFYMAHGPRKANKWRLWIQCTHGKVLPFKMWGAFES